MSPAQGP
nr:unknown [Lotus japonicus]